MAIIAATAVNYNVVQSIQVSGTTISVTDYDASGTATAPAVDNSPSTNVFTIYRDKFGRIFTARVDNTGAFITGNSAAGGGLTSNGPHPMAYPAQLFERFLEGLAATQAEVGDQGTG